MDRYSHLTVTSHLGRGSLQVEVLDYDTPGRDFHRNQAECRAEARLKPGTTYLTPAVPEMSRLQLARLTQG